MTVMTPLQFYAGDDWPIPCIYQVLGGAPIDLSAYTVGANLFTSYSAQPRALTVENGGIIATDLSAGQFKILVAKTITAAIQAVSVPASGVSPTRIQVFLTDGNGIQMTLAVIQIAVMAP